MNEHLRSEKWWRDAIQEGWVEFVMNGGFTHFVTLNFNIWRHPNTGKNVYSNGTFTNDKPYRPWDKSFCQYTLQLLQGEARREMCGKSADKDYWLGGKKSGWKDEEKIQHAKAKFRLFNTTINQKLFGKNFYKKPLGKQEQIRFLLFAENIKTNLHYHGFTRLADSANYTGKEDKFMKLANTTWTASWEKKIHLKNGEFETVNECIVPGGQLWIEKIKTEDDLRKTAEYSAKQMRWYRENDGLYITNYWTSKTH